jgi:hypothetical protein
MVSLKGNGNMENSLMASGLTFGLYAIFSLIFVIIWCVPAVMKTLTAPAGVSKPWARSVTTRRVADLNTLEAVTPARPTGESKWQKKSELTWQILITTSVLYLIPSLQMVITASGLYE